MYSLRARIGVITPLDDQVEYAFNKYAPEGVSFDSTRLSFPGPTPEGLVYLSDQLEEAARIDGATDLRILWTVLLPLCKATFAVIMLFTAVAKWNDYFSALLYLPTKSELFPLQMVLREILITSTSDISSAAANFAEKATIYKKAIEYACIVVSTLPILCVYPFVQKYFVTGVTLGAVKS